MLAGQRSTAVGVIPGGTANVWAAEVGIPADPVRAARVLVESSVRQVDVGHVGVESLTLGAESSERDRLAASAPGARRHFLLMAGLGVDAALMRRTPTELKHKLGIAAVVLSAMRVLPGLRTYRVDARAGEPPVAIYDGSALQLVVGNTRLYGKVARMTPDALLDRRARSLGDYGAKQVQRAAAGDGGDAARPAGPFTFARCAEQRLSHQRAGVGGSAARWECGEVEEILECGDSGGAGASWGAVGGEGELSIRCGAGSASHCGAGGIRGLSLPVK